MLCWQAPAGKGLWMPELPELEVVRNVLQKRVVDRRIDQVELIQPGAAIVVRDLTGLGVETALVGAPSIVAVARHGKFLLLTCTANDGPSTITINLKLSGRLQLHGGDSCAVRPMWCFRSPVVNNCVMWTRNRWDRLPGRDAPADAGIPDFADLGPEPIDMTLEGLRQHLRKFQGEIKGILVRRRICGGDWQRLCR